MSFCLSSTPWDCGNRGDCFGKFLGILGVGWMRGAEGEYIAKLMRKLNLPADNGPPGSRRRRRRREGGE